MERTARHMYAVVATALLGGLLVAVPADGATQTLTFSPVADALVRADRPTRSYGTSTTLGADASPVTDTLLRFEVSGVGPGAVSRATIRLYVTDSSPSAGSLRRVASQSWTEAVTWDTAPSADPAAISSAGAAVTGSWAEFDVTSLVTGDGTYSVRIASTNANGADFVSREGGAAQRPQLVVSTAQGDVAAPEVTVTSPTQGATVSGTTAVAVRATDDTSIAAVDVAVDGVVIASDTSSPYQVSWNTAQDDNGEHLVTAVARDVVGRTTVSSPVAVSVANSSSATAGGSFTFAAGGDHGANSRSAASLSALDASPAAFYLAIGDMDYDETPSDAAWCDYVHQRLPAKGGTFPFEVVAGNHEDDNGVDGSILAFASCLPDRLGATPGPGSVYGAEYMFDYPPTSPLARFLMLSPELTVDGRRYDYRPGTTEYAWVSRTIDEARAAGIPWIVAAFHFPCLSAGKYTCGAGPDLMNLLVSKKVDLMLHGHEHAYMRSKQLSLGAACTAISPTGYSPACVADDGTDAVYPKGTGTVDLVAGTFGRGAYAVSRTDPEAPYFAAMDSTTNGFATFRVTRDRLEGSFVPSVGSFTDSFAIVAGAAPTADRTAPTQPGTPAADTSVPGTVKLTWTPSSDDTEIGSYTVMRDGQQIGSTGTATFVDSSVGAGQQHTYAITAFDRAFNPSATSAQVTVLVPVGSMPVFAPDADASVYSGSSTNYGTSTTLATDASPTKDILLRFTVTGVGERSVTSAKVRLTCMDPSSKGGEVSLAASNVWDEASVVWATAPSSGQAVASLGAVVAGSTYEIDVSSVVTRDGTYTFRVRSTDANGADYASREGDVATRPRLALTLAE